jgi:hypothetical protein
MLLTTKIDPPTRQAMIEVSFIAQLNEEALCRFENTNAFVLTKVHLLTGPTFRSAEIVDKCHL